LHFKRLFACVVPVVAGAVLSVSVNSGTAAASQTKAESASMPLPLKVVGTQILNSKNEAVRLQGVNCASLEWTSNGEGHIVESVRVAIDDWHVDHASPAVVTGSLVRKGARAG